MVIGSLHRLPLRLIQRVTRKIRNGQDKIVVRDKGTDELKHAIETTHGGTATLAQSVPVRETFKFLSRFYKSKNQHCGHWGENCL
jgi:hypothetical protein